MVTMVSKPPAAIAKLAARIPRNATFRQQFVQCGKARCKKWHGPYWYAFWRPVKPRGEWAKGRRRVGETQSAYVGSDARLEQLRKIWAEWARGGS